MCERSLDEIQKELNELVDQINQGESEIINSSSSCATTISNTLNDFEGEDLYDIFNEILNFLLSFTKFDPNGARRKKREAESISSKCLYLLQTIEKFVAVFSDFSKKRLGVSKNITTIQLQIKNLNSEDTTYLTKTQRSSFIASSECLQNVLTLSVNLNNTLKTLEMDLNEKIEKLNGKYSQSCNNDPIEIPSVCDGHHDFFSKEVYVKSCCFIGIPETLSNQKSACESAGMELFTIESSEEFDFIINASNYEQSARDCAFYGQMIYIAGQEGPYCKALYNNNDFNYFELFNVSCTEISAYAWCQFKNKNPKETILAPDFPPIPPTDCSKNTGEICSIQAECCSSNCVWNATLDDGFLFRCQ